jgi:hypothetical protein
MYDEPMWWIRENEAREESGKPKRTVRFYLVDYDNYKKEIKRTGKLSPKFLEENGDSCHMRLGWNVDTSINTYIDQAYDCAEYGREGALEDRVVYDTITNKAYDLISCYSDICTQLYKHVHQKYPNVVGFSFSAYRVRDMTHRKREFYPKVYPDSNKPFYCPCMDDDIGCTCGG